MDIGYTVSLADLKTWNIGLVSQIFTATLAEGLVYSGHTYATDAQSQQAITNLGSMCSSLIGNNQSSQTFTQYDVNGVGVTLTSLDMVLLAAQLRQFVSGCYSTRQTHVANINATVDIPTLSAYDVTVNWPSNSVVPTIVFPTVPLVPAIPAAAPSPVAPGSTNMLVGGPGGTTSGDGGPITVHGGFPTIGNGGPANLIGADGGGPTGNGGSVLVQAGSTAGGTAGSITFKTSAATRLIIGPLGDWSVDASGIGTPGQVLTSSGPGTAPTWQNAGSASSLPFSGLTAAIAGNTINNAANSQVWQWGLNTINQLGLSITESVAGTGGGGQTLVDITTLLGSTSAPFRVRTGGVNVISCGSNGITAISGADITGPTAAACNIKGGNALSAASLGGGASLIGGLGNTAGTGGVVTVSGGQGGNIGAGGSVNVSGGSGGSTSGNGGTVTIQGGGALDGNGGSVIVQGRNGVGTNRNGGNVTINTGTPTGTGTIGTLTLQTGGVSRLVFGAAGDWTVNSSVGTSGQVLTSGGAGAQPSWTTLASGGTVTSVALSEGSTTDIYAITGSPVTGSGTLTFTLVNQTANTVFAGPNTGAATQPTFRALVAADIPSISLTAGVSGILPVANGGSGVGSSTGTGSVVLSNTPTLVTPVLGAATGTSLALGGGTVLTTTNQTGTGSLVLANTPTLVTPVLGAATGTSLALGGGTALTSTNQTGTGSLVLANTPTLVTPVLGAATGTSLALGGGTALTTTNRTGTGNLVLATSPALTTPDIGVATGTSLALGGGTALTTTNRTGTGNLVLATTPTLTTPVIGVATGTSLAVTGLVTSSGTAGIGYATGAGGTVTQATSRTTGVTLSKTCGTITTNTTSLAALAAATFTVTNTLVAISDVVLVAQRSGATNVKTDVRVTAVAAGSFNITVHNIDAATAEVGAIIINFVVIKAVTA